MASTITIREMLPGDWPSVQNIYQQGIDSNIATFQAVCPSFEEWDSSHLANCRFVALIDSTIAGWIVLSETSKKEAYRGVVEVSIYIHQSYARQGIGTALMKHLIVESEKKGYWMLYSSVIEKNTASIKFHQNCGFRQIGYREKIAKDRFNNWHNTVLFEKRSRLI